MLPTPIETDDLEKEIDSLLADGYRLDMIMPADAPRIAYLSKSDDEVKLTTNPKSAIPLPKSKGRAGMEYRDLIPDRLGGEVIASHITLNQDGAVADYVHYHKITFQLIFCVSGRIRVVYEDQGPPFWLEAGDAVLQPPQIRHRVLECTAGAEVIEITIPAEHETWVEHEMTLPNGETRSDATFGGQAFVHLNGVRDIRDALIRIMARVPLDRHLSDRLHAIIPLLDPADGCASNSTNV